MTKNQLTFIYLSIVMATVIWGLNMVLLKVLVTELPPATMTAFRIMTAGITTLIIIICLKSYRKMTNTEWRYILIGTLFGVVLHHLFIAKGLVLINASNASLILALLPITTAVMGVMFLGEKMTKFRLVGFIMALIGVFFIQGGSFSNIVFSRGELYLFIAMFVQAMSFIFIRKLTFTLDSKQATSVMFLIGSTILLMISLFTEPGGISAFFSMRLPVMFVFLFSGIVATGVGFIIFNGSIQRIGAGNTVIFNNLVPLFGLIFSAIFLKDVINIIQMSGFIFIVLGVLFGTGYVEAKFLKRSNRTMKSQLDNDV
ncbi:DMT family transporter [Phocicoccus pinnipedialis]|uniref:Putative DMT superfamily transporter inner membrane protein n=1 Tax=Phocicoccus pinnipedialis TaxID=110845 RepID=A0A6V7R5I4_9BACL|nr:DMT family transporter [Jeotgalicoccus pinnipedialis]MBP1939682.1 drug/metabolite transporter (DMT)-like permease [Jeotgalicoccus pinnipedialis]CAD2072304.1 putative DMT superfamily transporter inner membrane protein [Jeotgalicoccus pinnipedialis]